MKITNWFVFYPLFCKKHMIIYSEIYEAKIVLVEVTRETAEAIFPNRAIYYTTADGNIAHRAWHTKVGNKWHEFPESADGKYWIKKTIP
jgi:hypothetical protein